MHVAPPSHRFQHLPTTMSKFHSPYIFLPKTPALTAQRRIALDRYANTAQTSQMVLHVTLLAFDVLNSRPRSLAGLEEKTDKHGHRIGSGARFATAEKHNALYFLRRRLGRGYGTYGQWVFGMGWGCSWRIYLLPGRGTVTFLVP
jgi:hypothetical protein